MFLISHQLFTVICLTFLWRVSISEAYVDVCDEPHSSIYCSCDTRYGETTVVCFIHTELSSDDGVWRALADVENVVTLKLNSRLPLRLSYIPSDSLKLMSNLKMLVIQEGALGELKTNAVSDLKHLGDLVLESNEITSLESHAISNLPKLKKLTLSENFLQEIRAESLTGLLDLGELYLDRNNISRIEACAFCDLQNLKDLELWGNQITDLTDYTFRGLRFLKRLDLSRNQIRILNDKIFQSMPKLVELDMQHNIIDHIAPHAFTGLAKLQWLKLNNNKLKVLPKEVFANLPNLRSVELYYNELETLEVEVLEQMSNAKDGHFSFMLKENPFKCDCRLQWVKRYLKLNTSHLFTRELQELHCQADDKNGTLQLVHSLNMHCVRSSTHNHRTTPGSATANSDWIPIEISNPNKTKRLNDVTDPTYFSDDEDEDVEAETAVKQTANVGCRLSTSHFYFTVFVAMWIIVSVRKRKEACF